MESNDYYMKQALDLAFRAFEEDEVPIGAVIIDRNGMIIGGGYNQVEGQCTQLAHAELQAIKDATKRLGTWRLEGCTMVVTLEPCSMCIGAIRLSRMAKVIYGASSPVFGFQLDNDQFIPLYNNGSFLIESGVLKEECSKILKDFFQKKRNVL